MIPAQIMHLMEAAVRALAAASVVWVALRLLRVKSVVVEKTVWILLLAAALAMPLLPAGIGLPSAFTARLAAFGQTAWTGARQWSGKQEAQAKPAVSQALPVRTEVAADDSSAVLEEAAEAAAQLDSARLRAASSPSATSAGHEQVPVQTPPVASGLHAPWLPMVVGIAYGCVAMALLVRLFSGLLVALHLWRSSKPVLTASGLVVRSSSRVASPVTVGSGVLLPAGYAGWSEEKLRVALAHEQAHIRQRDFYLQIAAGFYAAIFWPSPLGWWLKHKLCELGEAISDRAGLEEAASRSSYARLLLEFAALPRPTVLGVAMARTSRLSQRIERLLNEASFNEAFAYGRRALLAVVVVPVALIAATALVRVEAATPQEQPQAEAQAPAPAPSAQPNEMTPPPPPVQQAGEQPGMMPPPPPGEEGNGFGPGPRPEHDAAGGPGFGPGGHHRGGWQGMGPGAGFGPRGESYALVGDEKDRPSFSVWGHHEEIEKALKTTHGHFLWFEHDGKSYIVDDPATVAKLEETFKGQQELGKQMREFDRQHREEFRKSMEKLREARVQEQVKVPDLSKEMLELNTALATLKSKQGATISQGELGEIERKLGEVQRRLGDAQGHRFGPGPQGKFPPLPNMDGVNKYGEQMGKLGSQMGKLAQENDQKARTIIDESLKNGKAKPIN